MNIFLISNLRRQMILCSRNLVVCSIFISKKKHIFRTLWKNVSRRLGEESILISLSPGDISRFGSIRSTRRSRQYPADSEIRNMIGEWHARVNNRVNRGASEIAMEESVNSDRRRRRCSIDPGFVALRSVTHAVTNIGTKKGLRTILMEKWSRSKSGFPIYML